MLTVLAHAKINYTLDILGRRDDGYHELETVMQSIHLHDKLVIEPSDHISLALDSQHGIGLWLPTDQRNDIIRAATLLQQYAGVKQGAHFHMTKYIPVQAGLGGGSADAAAALVGLNRLWGLKLSMHELAELAARIGSDVAFLLRGGLALGRGRGEQLTLLKSTPKRWLVLFKPQNGMSTSRAFDNFSWAGETRPHYSQAFMRALREEQNPLEYLANDLQPSVFAQLPELQEFGEKLTKAGIAHWSMTGSGSCVYAIASNRRQALQWRDELAPFRWWCFVTSTIDHGVHVREPARKGRDDG